MFCVSFVVVHSEWGSSAGENVPLCASPGNLFTISTHSSCDVLTHRDVQMKRRASHSETCTLVHEKTTAVFVFFFIDKKNRRVGSFSYLCVRQGGAVWQGAERKGRAAEAESAIREECRVTFFIFGDLGHGNRGFW